MEGVRDGWGRSSGIHLTLIDVEIFVQDLQHFYLRKMRFFKRQWCFPFSSLKKKNKEKTLFVVK